MVFCVFDNDGELETICINDGEEKNMPAARNLENEIESESIMHDVGYVASKFIQHQFGGKVQERKKTAATRRRGNSHKQQLNSNME